MEKPLSLVQVLYSAKSDSRGGGCTGIPNRIKMHVQRKFLSRSQSRRSLLRVSRLCFLQLSKSAYPKTQNDQNRIFPQKSKIKTPVTGAQKAHSFSICA